TSRIVGRRTLRFEPKQSCVYGRSPYVLSGGEQSPSKGGDGIKVTTSCPHRWGLSRRRDRSVNTRVPLMNRVARYARLAQHSLSNTSFAALRYRIDIMRRPWISDESRRLLQ